MTYHTSYYDDDAAFSQRSVHWHSRYRLPRGYPETQRHCGCSGEFELVACHHGYSDYVTRWWHCKTCQHNFCEVLEG